MNPLIQTINEAQVQLAKLNPNSKLTVTIEAYSLGAFMDAYTHFQKAEGKQPKQPPFEEKKSRYIFTIKPDIKPSILFIIQSPFIKI